MNPLRAAVEPDPAVLGAAALAPRPRVLVITPTYDERENLEALAEGVFETSEDVRLLIVDDASPDGTADHCERLMHRFPRLELLRRVGRRALGGAYLAGFRYGLDHGYDVIGTMDGDLSHAPEHLPEMLEALSAGADVVVGSRYVRDGGTVNWRLRRILLSWLANRFSAFLLRVPARDVTSGFRLYRADVLRRIGLDEIRSTGYSFLVELLYRAHRAGAEIAEHPIVFHDRRLGRSKLRSREIYLGAFRLLGLRLAPPDLPRHDRAASRAAQQPEPRRPEIEEPR
jgi:dolichol-phosphate mannosyltransferase